MTIHWEQMRPDIWSGKSNCGCYSAVAAPCGWKVTGDHDDFEAGEETRADESAVESYKEAAESALNTYLSGGKTEIDGAGTFLTRAAFDEIGKAAHSLSLVTAVHGAPPTTLKDIAELRKAAKVVVRRLSRFRLVEEEEGDAKSGEKHKLPNPALSDEISTRRIPGVPDLEIPPNAEDYGFRWAEGYGWCWDTAGCGCGNSVEVIFGCDPTCRRIMCACARCAWLDEADRLQIERNNFEDHDTAEPLDDEFHAAFAQADAWRRAGEGEKT